MNLFLDFEKACSDPSPTVEEFENWIRSAVDAVKHSLETIEVSMKVVGETEMSFLNSTFRGKNGPTNILSFSADLPTEVELSLLGDIAICAPLVRKEAAQQSKCETAHWAHLTVHGALHLMGFDHKNESQSLEMESIESLVLARLGIDNPYL